MKERLNELAQEIGQWAERNFKVLAPDLGMLEETGELTHCFLKRAQGIRGYDDPVKFITDAKDAICDIAVYDLHYSFMDGVSFESNPNCRPGLDLSMIYGVRRILGLLSSDVSRIVGGQVLRGGRHLSLFVLDHLVTISEALEFDFMESLNQTWEKVSKRDWVENPTNANVIAESR